MARKRFILFDNFQPVLKRGVRFLVWVILGLIVSLGLSIPQADSLGLQELRFGASTGASPLQPGHEKGEGLIEAGRRFYQEEKFAEAARVLQQAAKVYNERGNVLNEALALNYLSLTYQKLGEWEQAKDAIASSQALLQNIADAPTSLLAQVFNTQGRLQLARGQAEEAFGSWQKAAENYEKIGDNVGVNGSLLNQAQALEAMGSYRRSCSTVLQLFGQEGATCQELNQEGSEKFEQVLKAISNQRNSTIKALGLRSLGNLLRSLGFLEESQKILAQSLTVAEEVKSPLDVSLALLNLGNTEAALFKRAKELQQREEVENYKAVAIRYYELAASQSANSIARIQAQLNQLNLLAEAEQLAEGREVRSQILEQLRDLPASRAAVNARINLAEIMLKSDRSVPAAEIAELLNAAVLQAEKLGDTRVQSYAKGTLGKLYEYNRDWERAKTLTRDAIALANNAPEIEYQWQWQMGRILRDAREERAAIVHYRKAVEILKSLRADLVALNPDIQFDFRDRVESAYREYVDLLLRAETPTQTSLKQARQTIEDLQLAELDNFFRDACAQVKTQEIDAIVDTSNPPAAAIYTILLPERLEVILKLPQKDELRHYRQKLSSEAVTTILKELRNNLTEPDIPIQENIKVLSQQVYNWLLAPAKADLAAHQVKTLVFVLDGFFRNIPMGILYDGRQYLLENYSIVLTPGLQLVDTKPLKPEQLQAIAAGVSEARSGFRELPNVKGELEAIQSQISSSILFNKDFVTQSFQNRMRFEPKPIIHLATHGKFSSNPNDTFILAWDNPIYVRELNNLLRSTGLNKPNPIQLLVLSACQTAAGDERATLGLAGVAVRAGARTTLASLWNVGDESTAVLMKQFYRELIDKKQTKAEALRQAQMFILQDSRYNLPRFWAPYVLIGNWLYLSSD